MSDVDTITSSRGEPLRRKRIAQLLLKAILQTETEDAVRPAIAPDSESSISIAGAQPDASNAERVVQFLRVTGEASPVSIRSSLGLSRSGAFRILQSLAHSRRIVTHGQTRALVYRLNEREPPPEKLELN